MAPQECHQTRRVWPTVNHVAQANHPVFGLQSQAMEQGSECCQVSVDITNNEDAVTVFHSGLQISLERGVSERRSKREIQLATQAVHRRDGPFGQRLFESLYVLPPHGGGEEPVFGPFHRTFDFTRRLRRKHRPQTPLLRRLLILLPLQQQRPWPGNHPRLAHSRHRSCPWRSYRCHPTRRGG